jgi:hypothetical protein
VSAWQGLGYVLRRGWLWPLRFWLWPLDVVEEAELAGREWSELAVEVLGGAVWGAGLGGILWILRGEPDAV